MPSRPGREATERDRGARKRRAGKRATDRFAMAGAWVVLIERRGDAYLLTASHRFTASPTRCLATERDWWEMTTMEEKQKAAARLVAQARRGCDGYDVQMPCGDPEFLKECPTLAAYMTCDVDTEGKSCKTATLTIFFEDGVFKCVMRDRVTDRTLWATAPLLIELYGVLETRLTQDIVEWRRSPVDKRNLPRR